jgi:DNA adenine methylase
MREAPERVPNMPDRRVVLSPLRYPGGKRRLVPYIAAALAENDLQPDFFVEPYAGGASVSLELLYLDLVGRIVIGDSDPMVNAFWETVVTDVDWLCEQVESISLDLKTWEHMKQTNFRARRKLALACLYLNRTSFNGALHEGAGPIGGKAQSSEYDIGCRFPRKRLVSRLRKCAKLADRIDVAPAQDAMITVRNARDRARREDASTFFYLDPPFWAKSRFLYRHSFTDLAHDRLADQLHWLHDHFLLSYDPAPKIVELYTGHTAGTVAEIELLYSGSSRSAGTEIVISNLPKLPAETKLWRTSREWRDARELASRVATNTAASEA